MHFSVQVLVLAAVTTFTFATPVPSDFAEVEKRWAVGDSEQQIHSGLTHRDMTPAWPIARDSTTQETGFASATDFRSLEVAEQKRNPDPMAPLRSLVGKVVYSKGNRAVIARDESAPVVRPRKAMRYYFTS